MIFFKKGTKIPRGARSKAIKPGFVTTGCQAKNKNKKVVRKAHLFSALCRESSALSPGVLHGIVFFLSQGQKTSKKQFNRPGYPTPEDIFHSLCRRVRERLKGLLQHPGGGIWATFVIFKGNQVQSK